MKMNSSLFVGSIMLIGGSLWMLMRRNRANRSFPTLTRYMRSFGKMVGRMTGRKMVRRLWAV